MNKQKSTGHTVYLTTKHCQTAANNYQLLQLAMPSHNFSWQLVAIQFGNHIHKLTKNIHKHMFSSRGTANKCFFFFAAKKKKSERKPRSAKLEAVNAK